MHYGNHRMKTNHFAPLLFLAVCSCSQEKSRDSYITLLPLKNVEQNLSNQSFIRVHKSFIVSISKIESIENNETILQSARIPISRNYRDHVIEHVVNDKLWKK